VGAVKLSARDAARWLARPDPQAAGALLYGADAMRVALKRQALVAALIGPDGAAEMRVTRVAGAELRRDPAALSDAARATGFFPGPRAVVVDDATDGLADALKAALADWRPGDAQIVVTAGALVPGSTVRKAFEASATAVAIGVYADPPGRDEIEAELARAGLARVSRAAMGDIETLARALDPGDFAQVLAKLALYKRGDPSELAPEDVAACAPAPEAELDALLDLAADGRPGPLAAELRRLGARGGGPTALTIAAGRHFRALHAAACAGGDPEATFARLRPPVPWARRRPMAEQVRRLGAGRLEAALGLIMEAELALRSDRPVPGPALVERLFVRIAMLGGR
jgi:DNA polymerase-3 subunit delta